MYFSWWERWVSSLHSATNLVELRSDNPDFGLTEEYALLQYAAVLFPLGLL